MTPRTVVIASACLLSLGSATTTAFADEPTREELVEQLRQLQARVEQLEAKERSSPTTSPTAADVDRVVRDVLADAERRSRLMMQDVAITGGFDLQRAKFLLRSGDGNFLLMPG